MARRALASAAQLRELDGAWEKVATELGAAVTFALSQRAKDPLAAVVEHLIRHLPAGSMAALRAENAGLHAQVQELKREPSARDVPGEEAEASPALQALRDQVQAVLAELEAAKPSTAAAGSIGSVVLVRSSSGDARPSPRARPCVEFSISSRPYTTYIQLVHTLT